MAITSFREAGHYAKVHLVPDVIVKRRLNFITIHYMYMIGMSFSISLILYGIGDIPYIDALFFASGACTQSGLNTIDINLIHTGQQAMLWLGAMLCNPIIIHSVVVIVRLYWFEKRFKDVVREARKLRRTRSKARTNTFAKEEADPGKEELGVRGRAIKILRNTGRVTESNPLAEKSELPTNGKEGDFSDTSGMNSDDGRHGSAPVIGLRRPSTHSEDETRFPQQRSPDQHITFLENQRNPKDTETLRIPSPREFDRGGKPKTVDDEDYDELAMRMTRSPEETLLRHDMATRIATNEGANHIAFDEPRIIRDRDRDRATTFPRSITKQSTGPRNHDASNLPQPRAERSSTFNSLKRMDTRKTMEAAPYLSWQPTIGRNSFFVNLTEEQREELGGIEYRALKTLALVLAVYFLAFHILGVICLVPWILQENRWGNILREQGVGRTWWGVFTASSAFNDLGFTLTNNSMLSFQDATFPLLLMTFLIIIGNTGFPCMLRFCIWATSKVVPVGSGVWEELQFLLDHPRRCFTLLFPRAATWWLFGILVFLNGLDVILFVVLDLHDPVVSSIPGPLRFVDGLFQASCTRTAGFSVINLAGLHSGIQVSYLVMMYISVFPIAISMRRTNVYEERSLGIYISQNEDDEDNNDPSYVGAHLRKQLSFDLWYVFLGLFIIAIAEGGRLAAKTVNEVSFDVFSVLFEIVSAYGTVGLSLGYPTINASLSAEFSVVSKLVIIAMQIRGRHRGLPYELDRAILLPSESLHEKEAKEGERILQRRRSSLGQMSAVDGQMESDRFRAGLGLSTAYEQHDQGSRERGQTFSSQQSNNSVNQQSHARHGLGTAMFKLASAPDAIKKRLT